MLLLVLSVGECFVEGFSQSLWRDNTWWFVPAVRVIMYGYLPYHFGWISRAAKGIRGASRTSGVWKIGHSAKSSASDKVPGPPSPASVNGQAGVTSE